MVDFPYLMYRSRVNFWHLGGDKYILPSLLVYMAVLSSYILPPVLVLVVDNWGPWGALFHLDCQMVQYLLFLMELTKGAS